MTSNGHRLLLLIEVFGASATGKSQSGTWLWHRKTMFSPVQVVPSPVKPGLQVQLKLPTVLLHTALRLHANLLHSLMSVKKQQDFSCRRVTR